MDKNMASRGGVVRVLILTAVLVSCVSASKPPKSKVVRCAVCRSLVNELRTAILEVDPRKTIEVGSYRIEADGKQKLSSVKYAGSEIHMMDTMETVCQSMKDYAQARHKETRKLEAIKLVENGNMNPRMMEYDMVQDPDLNKGLEFHCEAIIEEHEDDIVKFFKENGGSSLPDLQEEFCGEVTSLCRGVKDEL
ncbi:Protein canopy 2 [Chionoecetes opilio]|uniref:Protein canopy 2 n=1 Tax=Chionoecetes opilio TaxID=41210 RepID=A0A8J4Y8Z3_CHIOP|nr:Protein canopy 2 [Chionoecetes opilio]